MQINVNFSRKEIFSKFRENLKLKRQRLDGVILRVEESPYIIVQDQMSTPTNLSFFSIIVTILFVHYLKSRWKWRMLVSQRKNLTIVK